MFMSCFAQFVSSQSFASKYVHSIRVSSYGGSCDVPTPKIMKFKFLVALVDGGINI